ncbi:non-hemolytic enterotoxin B/C [Chitinophaga jiangningensis]|uniref:Non-hemolytic enterotoxin B/C n=1 Tax=Chitinophaga jiangningensis TaxID=1419482 RepID=A0A1M7IPT0_9BACT|nr:HBL/NHE enterotoxin family protein [Chitinophaga jiangningensis]SHM42826.1 non-hemolytic enterotoxin B/C [Chitinophaga jiangningensis]
MKNSARLVALQPTPQQLTDYANALIVVNSYTYAVENQQLPTLNAPPTNYADFISAFNPVKSSAINWSETIFPSITTLPAHIINYAGSLFNLEETLVTGYLNILINDPGNVAARNGLVATLTNMQQTIQAELNFVTDIQSNLTAFTTDTQTAGQTLQQLAQQALSMAGADKTTIQSLNSQIIRLNNDVANAQQLLTVSEIGLAASIFVGLIGLVVCMVPGAQGIGVGIIIFGIAGLGASIAGTVVFSKEVQDLQNSINSLQGQVSGINQDIIQLQGVSGQINALQAASVQAVQALSTISGMWSQLDAAIGAVAAELDDVNNDITSEQFKQALSDFQAAEANWTDVITFATSLANINYSWQDSSGTWHHYGTQNPAADNGQVTAIPSSQAVA